VLRPLFSVGVAVALLGALIWVILRVRAAAQIEFESEDRLQATIVTCDLVAEHVELKGTWPKAWADLEALPARDWARFKWPADSKEVQARVGIDFSYDLDEIGRAAPESFTAVKPRGPSFPVVGYVDTMIERIRRSRKTR
jgi:hypothetical protein